MTRVYPDIAWTYDFPTRQLLPIAGLIAFYNEKVDIFLDGRSLERPVNLPSHDAQDRVYEQTEPELRIHN